MKRLKFCFDIDGTICETQNGAYEFSKPMPGRIEKINALYDAGHEITYFTARGTTTGIDWRELTETQLRAWQARYHLLLLGKPEADFYVDDKGINSEQFDWFLD